MIVVRVETSDGRPCRESPHLERIAELIGGGDDKFDAGDERNAELLAKSLDVFPDCLLQLIQWNRAESLVINFNRVRLFHDRPKYRFKQSDVE